MGKPTLALAADLALPLDAVTETFGVLARRGAGKTYLGCVMAEEMVNAGLQVIALDPLGAFWGLRSSADGQSDGIPITILGGDHGDIPLEPTAGRVIADICVETPTSMILDLSAFESNAAQDRFVTDFAERLYRAKAKDRRPLHLIVDEADSFAPQRVIPGQQRMLGAFEAIVRRGRIRGLGVTLITQRPAVLNKNVLTQIECLVTMQITGPQDRAAIDEWVRGNGTQEERNELVNSLASLERGEAWFWSPSWLRIFKRVRIRQRFTFDSSRTPEAGIAVAEPQRMAPVDLEALRSRIASTIERSRADDPQALRAEIVRLKALLDVKEKHVHTLELKLERQQQPQPPKEIVRTVPTVPRGAGQALDRLRHFRDKFSVVVADMERAFDGMDEPEEEPSVDESPAPIRSLRPVATAEPRPAEGISAPQQRILDALASFEALGIQAPSRSNVAVFASQSPTSSGYANNLGRLRTMSLIDYPSGGRVALTPAGRAITTGAMEITSLRQLHDAWSARLSAPQARILFAVIARYPESVERTALAAMAEQSATSSGYANNLGHLRSLGLIDYRSPRFVAATNLLFPEGLR